MPPKAAPSRPSIPGSGTWPPVEPPDVDPPVVPPEVLEVSDLKIKDPNVAMFGIAGLEEEVMRFAEVLERRVNAFVKRTTKDNYLERLEALYEGPAAERNGEGVQ